MAVKSKPFWYGVSSNSELSLATLRRLRLGKPVEVKSHDELTRAALSLNTAELRSESLKLVRR
jgi:hypothetical protein